MGPPRSGTSLTTRIVHELGFYADYGRADEFNEAGYWENAEAGRINGLIMQYFGYDGFSCEPLPHGWENFKELSRLDTSAKALVRSASSHGDWVVKNPQFCFTLPYWKKFLPIDTRYLICIRSPSSSAMSMARQRGMSQELGIEIWYNSVTSALKNTEGLDRMFVFYEDYFGGSGQIEKIGSFLGVRGVVGVASAIIPRLNHFDGGREELKMPANIKLLYDHLRSGKQIPKLETIYHRPRLAENLYYRALSRFVLRIGLERAVKLRQGFSSLTGRGDLTRELAT